MAVRISLIVILPPGKNLSQHLVPDCGGLLVEANKKHAQCTECSLEFNRKELKEKSEVR